MRFTIRDVLGGLVFVVVGFAVLAILAGVITLWAMYGDEGYLPHDGPAEIQGKLAP